MREKIVVNDDIFYVDNFLTSEECDSYVRNSEEIGFDEATINTTFGYQRESKVRNNLRVISDDQRLADDLWGRASEYVDERQGWKPVGLNERIRFYKYQLGHKFDWHYDASFERKNGERSWLTFIVYLSGEFDGGQTSFDDAFVLPEKGRALFFRHNLRHKGEIVSHGTKYVLRSDVMFERING